MSSKAYQIWGIAKPLNSFLSETEAAILEEGFEPQVPLDGAKLHGTPSMMSAISEALGAILHATSEPHRKAHAKRAAKSRIIDELVTGKLMGIGSTKLPGHAGPTYRAIPAAFWQELEIDWDWNAVSKGDLQFRNANVISASDPRVVEIRGQTRGRPSQREAIEEAVEIAVTADPTFPGWQNSKKVGHVCAIIKSEFAEIDFEKGGFEESTVRKTINSYLKFE